MFNGGATMIRMNRLLISAAVASACSPAMADNPQREGYVVDSRNVAVTSGAGQCWKTSQWTPALAVEPCDPVPRKVVVAPEPKPAPPPPQVEPSPPPPPPKVVIQSVELAADALFPFDEAELQPDGKSALNDFARQLSDVRVDAVLVAGHADRIGQPDYNQKLSERRANAVKEYLASAVNIPADRINVEPKGATEPVTRREDCRGLGGEEAIACLAPDRRVTVEVTGTKELKENAPK
jgi:OmpA-OmpF porin, OOP family